MIGRRSRKGVVGGLAAVAVDPFHPARAVPSAAAGAMDKLAFRALRRLELAGNKRVGL